jgi:hypothetical protein
MALTGIDHVQIAAPPGCEPQARISFGRLLGFEEIQKPEPLAARGGCWFQVGKQELPIGVEADGTGHRAPSGDSMQRIPGGTGWSSPNQQLGGDLRGAPPGSKRRDLAIGFLRPGES